MSSLRILILRGIAVAGCFVTLLPSYSWALQSNSSELPLGSIQDIRHLFSLSKLFWTLVVFGVGYFLNRLVARILENFSERFPNYRLFLKRLLPIVRISIWILTAYVAIQGVIQPPWQTLVTVLASFGLAVGFASQDILKNIFGGIMILLDRPFQVGDKIQVEGHYGEVVSIGLRSTRVVTPDDSMVSVPNGEIMNRSVSNANSGELNCQVVTEFYLPDKTSISEIRDKARKVAITSPYVYLKKPVSIVVKEVVEGQQKWLKLRVKAYVFDIRYEFAMMTDITDRLRTILAGLQKEAE